MRMIGPFEIGEVLARGGSSVVHVARWRQEPDLDLVAKVATAGAELQLHHENATMRDVVHPSLLAPVALVDDTASVALVLPRAACSLRAHAGRLTADETAQVVVSIAASLDALHRAGFAHGDVSAANILVMHDGSAVLADLGDARRCTAEAARADVAALVSIGLDSLATGENGQLATLLERVRAEPISPAALADAVKASGGPLRRLDPHAAPALVDEPPTMATG